MIENKAFLSLREEFKPIVKEILEKLELKGWQPIVAEGLRTKEQQAEKVKLGYSTTMNSVHLSGLAADIVDKRYMWTISNVNQFWWDLYEVSKEVISEYDDCHLRYGLIWDHPEREALYKRALDEKRPGLITYFCDCAHIELHLDT